MTSQTMKAVNYQGPYKVKVQDIELPKLEHPDDVIVKVTTVRFPNLSVYISQGLIIVQAAICGSDLQ
jgi:hypothetical protein